MTRVVVADASAIVDVLFEPARHPRVTELIGDEACHILVPHVCDLEVVSAVRSIVRRGVADVTRAEAALTAYLALPLERFDHGPLLRHIFEMRANFSAYDAAYVALAEAVDATLYTSDVRLAGAVRAHSAVEVVEV